MSGWPFPGMDETARARAVAATVYEALVRADAEAALIIGTAAGQAGESWLLPALAIHQPDDLVSVAEGAELVGKSVRTLYGWIKSGQLRAVTVRGKTRLRVEDLLAAEATPTHARAG